MLRVKCVRLIEVTLQERVLSHLVTSRHILNILYSPILIKIERNAEEATP